MLANQLSPVRLMFITREFIHKYRTGPGGWTKAQTLLTPLPFFEVYGASENATLSPVASFQVPREK